MKLHAGTHHARVLFKQFEALLKHPQRVFRFFC